MMEAFAERPKDELLVGLDYNQILELLNQFYRRLRVLAQLYSALHSGFKHRQSHARKTARGRPQQRPMGADVVGGAERQDGHVQRRVAVSQLGGEGLLLGGTAAPGERAPQRRRAAPILHLNRRFRRQGAIVIDAFAGKGGVARVFAQAWLRRLDF